MEYLYILKQALVWLLTTFWCYQFIISLCALIKLKDKTYIINNIKRGKKWNIYI